MQPHWGKNWKHHREECPPVVWINTMNPVPHNPMNERPKFHSKSKKNVASMKLSLSILCVCIGLGTAGCFMLGMGAPKKNPERDLYQEIMTAFENRAYETRITASEQFLSKYPKSEAEDDVLMRMGESFEGLLTQNYQKLVDEGMDEKKAQTSFLARYGKYNCWPRKDGALVYDKRIFRRLLQEHPESHYADEAYYDLIPWERNLDEDPPRIEREISYIKDVLRKYPTTTLSPKILFQVGDRYHLLYEIYSFSQDHSKRDQAKAQESYQQAEYSYNLCLRIPHGSEYSNKAFRNLEMLKQGTRVHLKQP